MVSLRPLLVGVLAAMLGASGCTTATSPRPYDAESVRVSVEKRLQMPLERADDVTSSSILTDVLAIFSGATRRDRLLLIVFDSSAATVQATGRIRTSGEYDTAVLRRSNVVAFYTRAPRAPDRRAAIRAALRASARRP